MTTDIVQNKYTVENSRLGFLRKRKKQPGNVRQSSMELSREEGFVDGTYDILDLLAQHSLEKDGYKRSMSATIALLKRAQATIEQAEQRIASQSNRIKKLEVLTTTDELTGLGNRRGFVKAFMREVARTKRGHNEGGLLIFVDLENYKTVHKTQGNEASDTCVKLIASILKNEIRDMDVAARLHDDEFVLLLSNTSAKEALERTQKLSLRLNNLSLIWHGQEIQLSSSVSLKTYGPGDQLETLLSANTQEAIAM